MFTSWLFSVDCLFSSHFFSLFFVFSSHLRFDFMLNLQILLLLPLALCAVCASIIQCTIDCCEHYYPYPCAHIQHIRETGVYVYMCISVCVRVCKTWNRLDCTKCESKWKRNSVTSRSLVRIFHIGN